MKKDAKQHNEEEEEGEGSTKGVRHSSKNRSWMAVVGGYVVELSFVVFVASRHLNHAEYLVEWNMR
jgi:hypothetical protein